MIATLDAGAPVGIVDDLPDDRKETRVVVRAAGFEPVEIDPSRVGLDELVTLLLDRDVAGVVFDHRLSQRAPVPYNGATAAAECFDRHLPAILRTNYKGPVDDLSIRRHRSRLPRVLDRRSTGPDIADALAQTASELQGNTPRDRRGQPALVEIVDVASTGDQAIVDVVVPAWDAVQVVALPLGLFEEVLPTAELSSLRGVTMTAVVNVWAEDAADLYFRDIELAEPPPEDFLAWPPPS